MENKMPPETDPPGHFLEDLDVTNPRHLQGVMILFRNALTPNHISLSLKLPCLLNPAQKDRISKIITETEKNPLLKDMVTWFAGQWDKSDQFIIKGTNVLIESACGFAMQPEMLREYALEREKWDNFIEMERLVLSGVRLGGLANVSTRGELGRFESVDRKVGEESRDEYSNRVATENPVERDLPEVFTPKRRSFPAQLQQASGSTTYPRFTNLLAPRISPQRKYAPEPSHHSPLAFRPSPHRFRAAESANPNRNTNTGRISRPYQQPSAIQSPTKPRQATMKDGFRRSPSQEEEEEEEEEEDETEAEAEEEEKSYESLSSSSSSESDDSSDEDYVGWDKPKQLANRKAKIEESDSEMEDVKPLRLTKKKNQTPRTATSRAMTPIIKRENIEGSESKSSYRGAVLEKIPAVPRGFRRVAEKAEVRAELLMSDISPAKAITEGRSKLVQKSKAPKLEHPAAEDIGVSAANLTSKKRNIATVTNNTTPQPIKKAKPSANKNNTSSGTQKGKRALKSVEKKGTAETGLFSEEEEASDIDVPAKRRRRQRSISLDDEDVVNIFKEEVLSTTTRTRSGKKLGYDRW